MMKYLNKLLKKVAFSILTVGTLASCDLKIQESYDFQPGTIDIPTFENQTAWDWLQTQQTLLDDPSQLPGKFSSNKFNYLVKAIEVTGTQEIYQTGDKSKTFFLPNNLAFTDVKQGIFKQVLLNDFKLVSDNGTPDDKEDDFYKPIDEVFENVAIDKLTDLLNFQILGNNYVDQLEALPVAFKVTDFQTLRSGNDGILYIRRTFRNRIEVTINQNFKNKITPRGHNYKFKNGIGHLMQERFYK